MAYRLLYHPDVRKKDLAKIACNIKESICRAIEERLAHEPFLLGKPLRHSLKGHRRLQVGDYSIVYRIEGEDIIILTIGHRKEVYTKVLSRV